MKKRRQGTGIAQSGHQTHFTAILPHDVEGKPRHLPGPLSTEASSDASRIGRSGSSVRSHIGSSVGKEADRP
jgi:hypothetical protein